MTKIFLCIFTIILGPPFIWVAGTFSGPIILVNQFYQHIVKDLSDYTFRRNYKIRLAITIILGFITYFPLIPIFAVGMIFVIIYLQILVSVLLGRILIQDFLPR